MGFIKGYGRIVKTSRDQVLELVYTSIVWLELRNRYFPHKKIFSAILWVLFDALPCDLKLLSRLDRKIRTFEPQHNC